MSDETLHSSNTNGQGYDPLSDFPGQEPRTQAATPAEKQPSTSQFELFWERLTQASLLEPVLRGGTIAFSLFLVILVVWAMRTYLDDLPANQKVGSEVSAFAAAQPTPTLSPEQPQLAVFNAPDTTQIQSVARLASLRTTVPTRARVDVITYTVQAGDSVFGIAENFGLKPETIMWANTNILLDNPHRLQVGQIINIMPTNGTYHKWSAGENLERVADFYGVSAMKIIEWPGNPFDIYTTNIASPSIAPGTMLIVPEGRRAMVDYGPPRIPRDDPAIARTYGPGHCGVLMDGLIGDAIFMWPAPEQWLSGYDFSPETNHHGIDIAGNTGDPIWAADDGVVVYAGWSNSGYGNLVVLDHGNEWQTLYGHLDSIFVNCGESVFQGAQIATMGNTGNSSGSHLHFEMLFGSAKVNPWNFLQ